MEMALDPAAAPDSQGQSLVLARDWSPLARSLVVAATDAADHIWLSVSIAERTRTFRRENGVTLVLFPASPTKATCPTRPSTATSFCASEPPTFQGRTSGTSSYLSTVFFEKTF